MKSKLGKTALTVCLAEQWADWQVHQEHSARGGGELFVHLNTARTLSHGLCTSENFDAAGIRRVLGKLEGHIEVLDGLHKNPINLLQKIPEALDQARRAEIDSEIERMLISWMELVNGWEEDLGTV